MRKKLDFDYVIVGAGPAGLQLGYLFEKAGRSYIILERGDTPGTFFKTCPRHGTLLSINKIHTGFDDSEINLRWDWNSLISDDPGARFREFSQCYLPHAGDMVRYLADFADRFNLNVAYGVRIVRVARPDCYRLIDARGNEYTCRRLIIATGNSQPYIPEIPGIELTENYASVSTDPDNFTNQRVLIIGKGNSAFETANNLIETAALIHLVSPRSITMAWATHYPGHLRAVNNDFLDTYQLKSQNAILDANVTSITRNNEEYIVAVRYSHAKGEREELVYDRVISCTGFGFDAGIFEPDVRPNLVLDGRLPEQTSSWESTNVDGLYFAGTLMQMRDYKRANGAFIHGFRYNIRALHLILEEKYHGAPWPCRRISSSPEVLTQAIVERINSSSALWQQFGSLCDLVVFSDRSGSARYYEEVPVDLVMDGGLGPLPRGYMVTLEYGEHGDNSFATTRFPDPEHADRSTFLHPIIRYLSGFEEVTNCHLLENLGGVWADDVHVRPLMAFLDRHMTGTENDERIRGSLGL